jgi:hypothetical protein
MKKQKKLGSLHQHVRVGKTTFAESSFRASSPRTTKEHTTVTSEGNPTRTKTKKQQQMTTEKRVPMKGNQTVPTAPNIHVQISQTHSPDPSLKEATSNSWICLVKFEDDKTKTMYPVQLIYSHFPISRSSKPWSTVPSPSSSPNTYFQNASSHSRNMAGGTSQRQRQNTEHVLPAKSVLPKDTSIRTGRTPKQHP